MADRPASSSSPEEAAATRFDAAARWRAEIISDFRLRGEERCAAASPAYGFPQLLDQVVSLARDTPPGLWLDIGGGLGGLASWIERRSHQRVISVDASSASVHAAAQLFPTLMLAVADGERLPFERSSVDAAVLSGVISLCDRVDEMLAEVVRVLAPAGVVVVADLWSSTTESCRSDPNRFWSLREIDAAGREHGLDVEYWAVCETSVGWWSGAAVQIDEELERRYGHDARYRLQRDDQAHVRSEVDAGNLIAATAIFRVRDD